MAWCKRANLCDDEGRPMPGASKVSVFLPTRLKTRIQTAAKAKGVSVSTLIAKALAEALKPARS